MSRKQPQRCPDVFAYHFDHRWCEGELFDFVLMRAVREHPLPDARQATDPTAIGRTSPISYFPQRLGATAKRAAEESCASGSMLPGLILAYMLSVLDSDAAHASQRMVGFAILDRLLKMLSTARPGKSIHGYTELDTQSPTILSRRIVNVALFTAALPLGLGLEAFCVIVAWQAVSAAFHMLRVIQFWNDSDNEMMYKGST
jgi:hypothetical protein